MTGIALLEAALAGEAVLIADGAMGTMLTAAGALAPGQAPFELVLDNPRAVTAVQRAYVEAGAQLIIADTFGATRYRLGERARVEAVNQAAVECAHAAGAPLVAGDIGPIGELLEPYGDLEEAEAFELLAEQARALAAAGCDLFTIETMTDLTEATIAVDAVRSVSDRPVFVTMSFGEAGRTFMGVEPAEAARTLLRKEVAAIGANCSVGPRGLVPVIEAMAAVRAQCDGRPVALIAKPNAGLPVRQASGETVYEMDPATFAAEMAPLLAAGATIVGGCCGTTPAHIAALADEVATR